MSVASSPPRWGFIGAGKMATALARGLIRSGVASRDRVRASDPIESVRQTFVEETGAVAQSSNIEVCEVSDVLVLAVKPQSMPSVLAELGPVAGSRPLIVSVAAGIRIDAMAEAFGESSRIIRVMPNTPAIVGNGAAAYCLGTDVTAADEALVRLGLESIGCSVRVSESLMDAVTGLSGSGPAYVYMFIDALSDGGVRMGLPREVANLLAAQTVLGAARMVQETGKHPGMLKDEVTSPGGTTIAGLHALERGGFRASVMNAIEAATLRSAELGQASEEGTRRA
jgi:pyrroline-5-carboxylate reductase